MENKIDALRRDAFGKIDHLQVQIDVEAADQKTSVEKLS